MQNQTQTYYFSSNDIQFGVCKYCEQKINCNKISSHELKCKILTKIKKFKKKKQQENNSQRQQNKQIQLKQLEQQKIPCTYCGYLQSFKQLDTHCLQCQIQKTACPFCNSPYPLEILQDHLDFCQKQKQKLLLASQKCQQKPAFEIIQNTMGINQKTNCDICYKNFKFQQTYVNFKCGHNFHGYCVQAWLQNNLKCFLCHFSTNKA